MSHKQYNQSGAIDAGNATRVTDTTGIRGQAANHRATGSVSIKKHQEEKMKITAFFLVIFLGTILLGLLGIEPSQKQQANVTQQSNELGKIDSLLHSTQKRAVILQQQTIYTAETVRELYGESAK